MATTVFDAQIKAIDAASGPIRAMVRGMQGIIAAARGVTKTSTEGARAAGQAGKEAGAAIEHAAHTAEAAHLRYFRSMGAHVRILNTHFGSLNASIGAVSGSFTKFLPMLGALGAGGSLLGLFAMTKAAAEARVEGQALAASTGLNGKQLGGFMFAAKETGVETEAMAKSLEKLSLTVGKAAVGKGKEAAAIFQHLGIALKDASGHTRSTAELMPELAEAFKKTTDESMRSYMAVTLFGKSGEAIANTLKLGRDGLNELTTAGARFAYVATKEQGEGLDLFHKNYDELEAAVGGFKKQIVSSLGPVFAPMIGYVRDWVMANRAWIATGITDKVKLLGDTLKAHKEGIKATVKEITEWAKWTRDLIEAHSGLATIIGAFILVMGSPLGGAITGTVSLFTTLGRTLLWLGTVMWANPILAAVGVVAVAAFLLYENWDWVKAKVGAIFEWFSHQDGWVQALLMTTAPFIFLPMKIYQNWGPIKDWFANLWDGVTAVFDTAWSKIQPIVESLKSAAGWVKDSWLGQKLGVASAPAVAAVAAAAPRAAMPTSDGGLPSPWANPPPAPNLYRPDGPAMANMQSQGEVHVKVDIGNAPPGTKVESSATGIAQPPDTSVGFSNPMAFAI